MSKLFTVAGVCVRRTLGQRNIMSIPAAARNAKTDHFQSGLDGRVWTEFIGEVAVIRLACGENRMNNNFLDSINRCLDQILERQDVKAVVTLGEGRFYSNGLDLKWLQEVTSVSTDDFDDFIRKWHATLRRILLFPLPTVAALNGHAFAGGAFLTLCHDYRVMQSGKGWFSINEVHLGMQIPKWLIKLTTLKIPGAKSISDVLIFGKRFTAERALEHGIIQKISSEESLLKDAIALATDSFVNAPSLQRSMVETMKEDTYDGLLALFDDSVKLRLQRSKV